MKRSLVLAAILALSFGSAIAAQTPAAPQAEIPGVLKAGAKVDLVKDGLNGLEGPVPSGDRRPLLHRDRREPHLQGGPRRAHGFHLAREHERHERAVPAQGRASPRRRKRRQADHRHCAGRSGHRPRHRVRRKAAALAERPHRRRQRRDLFHRSRTASGPECRADGARQRSLHARQRRGSADRQRDPAAERSDHQSRRTHAVCRRHRRRVHVYAFDIHSRTARRATSVSS